MTTSVTVVIIIIVAFFVINAVVIRKFHIPQETIETYAVGGRQLGWILVAFSYLGAWYVGAIYTGWVATSADLGMFAQYLGIYSIGGMIVMYLIASNVWVWGKVYNLNTIADMMTLRYRGKVFSKFFVVTVLCVNIFWLVVEMVTLGYCFMVATNAVIDFRFGIIIASSFVLVYSIIGGARASAVGNLVQGLFFGVVATIVFFYLIIKTYGGIVPLFDMVIAHRPELVSVSGYRGLWMSSILTGILGAYVWPQIFNRIYMTKGPLESKKGVFVAPFIVVLVTVGLLWLALGGSLLDGYPDDRQLGMFWIANQYGGPFILGLVSVFAIAACMSTISSVSHVIGVMIGSDFLPHGGDNKRMVKNSRSVTAIVGVLAIMIALLDFQQLNFVALAMYEFIIQAFVPMFFGIMWKRGNLQGAFAGMITGVGIALIGFFGGPELFAWAGGFSAGVVGLIANFIVYYICAMVFGKQSHVDEMWESLKTYDEMGTFIGNDSKLSS